MITLKADLKEAENILNAIGNVHLIQEAHATTKATVHEKGKNGYTKFFLVPKDIREGINMKKEASCLKLDTKDKYMWVYFMDKF